MSSTTKQKRNGNRDITRGMEKKEMDDEEELQQNKKRDKEKKISVTPSKANANRTE